MINNSYITNLGSLHFTEEIKTGRMLISLQGIIHAQREAEFKQGLLDPEPQLYMLLTQKITFGVFEKQSLHDRTVSLW